MKDQFLKLANIKDEKSFYKAFPTEESFLAKYGKQVKKLQMKQGIQKAQTGNQFPLQEPNSYVAEQTPYTPGFAPMQAQGYNPIQSMNSTQSPLKQIDTGYVPENATSKTNWAQGVPVLSGIVRAGQALHDEKHAMQKAQQWEGVSDVALKASQTQDVDLNRMNKQMMWRPENDITSGNELFPTKGVGTNILAAKKGGKIPKAQWGEMLQGLGGAKAIGGSGKFIQGFNQFAGAGGVDTISKGISSLTGENAGGDLGGTLGGTIGGIFGPVGSAIGQIGGQLIGTAIDRRPAKIKAANNETYSHINQMAFGQGMKGLQQQNQSFMRTGGNIRQNNIPDLQLYDGGTEQVSPDMIKFNGASHANGGQDITYGGNPVEVEGGEYASEMPDAKTGEDNLVVFGNLVNPLTKRKFKYDAGKLADAEKKQTNITTKATEKIGAMDISTPHDKLAFTSLKLMNLGANMKLKKLDDEKNTLAAMQSAINDTAEEYSLDADNLAKGNIKQAKYGDIVSKAQNGDEYNKWLSQTRQTDNAGARAAYQNYITNYKPHEDAVKYLNKDYDLYREYRASGKGGSKYISYDDFKKKIFGYGREDWMDPTFKEWYQTTHKGKTTQPTVQQTQTTPTAPVSQVTKSPTPPSTGGKTGGTKKAPVVTSDAINWKGQTPATISGEQPGQFNVQGENTWFNYDRATGEPLSYPFPVASDKTTPIDNNAITTTAQSTLNPWITGINAMLPLIRPSDAEELDPRQLTGEMFALSQNQLESVQAQTYNPQLSTPYDVSLQDMLNENTAATRAAQRLVGYNPAAEASIAGQAYGANQKVLAEQFRMNQAMKDKVYGENRNILNDAQLKNLGIYDNQYTRQAEAKSNTKAVTQAALNSISEKFLKNKLENRTLAINENLYNYRFDRRGRAWNWNPLAQFNTEGSGQTPPAITNLAEGREPLYRKGKNGEMELVDVTTVPKAKQTNGGIVRAIKNL